MIDLHQHRLTNGCCCLLFLCDRRAILHIHTNRPNANGTAGNKDDLLAAISQVRQRPRQFFDSFQIQSAAGICDRGSAYFHNDSITVFLFISQNDPLRFFCSFLLII